MSRALLIAVRFIEGRYHGSGDWPPSPARLFQALVAGAARGRAIEPAAHEALRWLEALPPPRIAAVHPRRVDPLKLYVPNNDLDAVGGDPAKVGEIRVGKRLECRLFDAAHPVLYAWNVDEDPPGALRGVVERLYRLGRGHDAAFATLDVVSGEEAEARLAAHPGQLLTPGGGGSVPVPVRGTLESLRTRHEAFLHRLVVEGKGRKARQVFVQPPRARFGRTGYEVEPVRLLFELRRPDDTFAAVPLDRAGVLADGLRKAAARRLEAHGIEAGRFVVGRGADRDDLPRRIVVRPLPSIGHPEADPSIRRVAIDVPAQCPVAPRDLAWAFVSLGAQSAADAGDPDDPPVAAALALLGGARLVETPEGSMTARYARKARRWRTVTAAPLTLAERRRIDPAEGPPKGGGERAAEEEKAAAAVVRAMAQAGVRTRARAVCVQREPFGRREAMAEAFAPGTRFAKHAFWHVDVTFDRPVRGPLALGDGRFIGLGLMRPVAEVSGAFALVCDRSWPQDAGEALADRLRRAIMSRVKALNGRDLPPFFHGHGPNGEPLRNGTRAHVSTVADPARRRLVVFAPHLVAHRERSQDEGRHVATLARILDDPFPLTAGPLGVFGLSPRRIGEDDPLLCPSPVWRSVGPYVMTRHPKGRRAADAVGEDVAAECRRRGLPVPQVSVLGEEGGLRFSLELAFPRPVEGPLVMGRTASRGGLFEPA